MIRLKQKIASPAAKFRAVGSSTRLSIVYLLAASPLEVPHIMRRLRLSPSLVSHHMKILEEAGWVTKSKFGKSATYTLSHQAVGSVRKFLGSLLSESN